MNNVIDELIERETETYLDLEEDISSILSLDGEDYHGLQLLIRQVMRHPILSREQEQELFQIIQNGGDYHSRLQARSEIILHNQKLVFSVAKQYRSRDLALEDLIQEGNIGLIIATDKFDPTRGVKFSTYAIWWIRQAILRGIKSKGRTVRIPEHLYGKFNHLKKTIEQLRRFSGQEPSLDEIAEASSMSRAKIEQLITMMQVETSLDREIYDDSENSATILDFIPDENATPAEIVSQKVFDEQLEALISSSLNEREAEIIKRRFGFFDGEEQTLETIAQEFGLSKERVRQIEASILGRIKATSAFGAAAAATQSAPRSDDITTDKAARKAYRSEEAVSHRADKLIEVFEKLQKISDVKDKHCLVCGKKLKGESRKYCRERCRRQVIYEQGGVKYIRTQRQALLLSQRQLAAKIGVTKETISSWERGLTKPDFKRFDKLLTFFENQTAIVNHKITGSSISEFRLQLRISQRQLATFLGVTKETIGSWERGINKPCFVNQKKLREVKENPDRLTRGIQQRKCAICGSFLPLKAKKYCSASCRCEGLAEWKERYRQNLAQVRAKEQGSQLTLFDISLFTKEKTPKK